MNWLKKLWNGEYSLPMSYWVFMVILGNFGIVIAMQVLTAINIIPLLAIGIAVAVAYTVVAVVGTWRAASKYAGWKGWAIIVQVLIALGIIKICLDVIVAVLS